MVRINLLPIREILRKRELKQFAFVGGAILAVTIAVTVLTYLWLSNSMSTLVVEKGREQKKLARLKKKNEEINRLTGEIARLQRQVDTIKKLTKIRDTPAPFMAALAKAIPDEVWVDGVVKTGKSFSLVGQGIDNTVVVKFVKQLQDVKSGEGQNFFRSVRLLQTVRKGRRGGQGSMDFKVVGTIR